MDTPKEFDGVDDARLDRATADRLARLRSLPVDTTRLERLVQAQVPRPGAAVARPRFTIFRLRPIRAVAASLLLLTGLAAVLLLTTSGGPVLASPAQMAQMHEDLVAGRVPVMWADSVEAANRMLASKSPESPEIPGVPSLPADHAMACCMRSVKDKKVACLLLRTDGVPVTLTVANAADMSLPKSPTVTRGGVTYHQQSSGKLNMVMTERNRRWVCLIGELPAERLMDVADQLRF
jgi:hypothetical protein